MNSVLVKYGRHQRPMAAVLNRYKLGTEDQYGRGVWFSEADLYCLKEEMKLDNTRILQGAEIYVQGTNMHNHVSFSDFENLFK